MPAGTELDVDDLGIVLEELYTTRSKWYYIGLTLKIDEGTLRSIKRHGDEADHLCELLKLRLRNLPFLSWNLLISTLRSSTVGENQLAGELAAKYCPEEKDTIQGEVSSTIIMRDTHPIEILTGSHTL